METTRKICVTVHQAVGLKPLGARIGRMRPYANIYLAGENIDNSAPQETPTDNQGHTEPRWDCSSMVFELPPEAINGKRLYSLICEIKHDSSLPPDRLIGKAAIPIQQLLIDREKFSYLVMKKGKGHGSIVLSHYLIPPPPAAAGGVVPQADTPIFVPETGGPPAAAVAAGGGEDGAQYSYNPTPVAETDVPPPKLLSAQAPLPPATATTSKPLVAMKMFAEGTSAVVDVVNTMVNITDG